MSVFDVGTALLFYLPFLLTMAFGLFALGIGLLVLFSGTILVLCLAAYGLYSLSRDTGLLRKLFEAFRSLWSFASAPIVKNLKQSFLVKGVEKLPAGAALYICHPHGLFGYSWLLHFLYQLSEWPETTPRPLLAIHSIFFRIPFIQDILHTFHCIEAQEEFILKQLRNGKSVALVTGGIEEMRYNGKIPTRLVLQKRRGYARIAKEANVPIVPLFTEGEAMLFPPETWGPWVTFTQWLYRWTHLEFPLPSLKSVTQWSQIVKGPLQTPVTTFVLGTLHTQDKSVDTLRKECVVMYKRFFKEHKMNVEIIG